MSKHIIFLLQQHLTPLVNFAKKYLDIISHIIWQKSTRMLTYFYNACCICKEIYNLEERKPLVLPCSHIFCQGCLQKMETKNNFVCPICGRVWSLESFGCLPFVHQLVEMTHMTKCNSSGHVNICDASNGEDSLWCKKCKVSICSQCLIEDHKTCDWVLLENMTGKIQVNLEKSVSTARSILHEKIYRETSKNDLKLTDIREKVKKLQYHEKRVLSFGEKLSARKKKAMQLFENCDSISSNGSVNELRSTITEVLALLDDKVTPPMIPKFLIVESDQPERGIDSEDPAYGHNSEDQEYGHNSEDPAYGHNSEDQEYGHNSEDPAYGHNSEDPAYGHNSEDPAYGHNSEDQACGHNSEDQAYGHNSEDPAYEIGRAHV